MNAFVYGALVVSLAIVGGCSTRHEIPDSQLSSTEIRAGESAAKQWIEPLTSEQKEAFSQARKNWAEDDLGTAWRLLKELRSERPDHPDLLANSAIVALARKQDTVAQALFRETLKVDPGHRVASNNLALLLKDEGEFAEARKVLIRALEQSPTDPTLHYNLAVIYELYLQDLDKALRHYHRFQQLSEEPDQKVAGWIADLERRVEK